MLLYIKTKTYKSIAYTDFLNVNIAFLNGTKRKIVWIKITIFFK